MRKASVVSGLSRTNRMLSVGSLVAHAFACEGARVFLRAFRSSARRGSRMRTWLGSYSEADG